MAVESGPAPDEIRSWRLTDWRLLSVMPDGRFEGVVTDHGVIVGDRNAGRLGDEAAVLTELGQVAEVGVGSFLGLIFSMNTPC